MKVKEIIKRTSFDELLPVFNQLFVVNCGHALSLSDTERWRSVYSRILSMKEKKKEYHYIKLIDRWEGCSPDIDMNCLVYNEEGMMCPVADYNDVPELLSMEVFVESDISISEKELAAGLFWEFFFNGIKWNDDKKVN